jgi:methylmalonyl-CoA mutase
MSAILGGADSLTVEPFDIVFRHPDEFSERIARNQQLILKEEAYFDKVADPAAGSYYIENLTSLIAENAWKLFLEIEDQGGFLSCLKSGLIQRKLSESSSVRKSDIASGKEVLLGTNRFPDFTEKAPSEIDLTRVFKSPVLTNDPEIEPIRLFRGSEEQERMRLETDKGGKF